MTPDRGKIPATFSLLIWFLLWEAVGRAGWSSIVPPVSHVLIAGVEVFSSQKFLAATRITLEAFALGMACAIAVGVPLGVLMGRFESVSRILGLWVSVFVSAPISALVPILMAVIGIGQPTVVVTVFLFAVFVIALDTQE